jgi:hypothetical protein
VFTILGGSVSIYSFLRTASIEPKSPALPPPQVTCVLDERPQKDHFLLFSLKNEGYAPITSVTIDHFTMRYDVQLGKIKMLGADGGFVLQYNEPGRRWMFLPALAPNGVANHITGEFALRDASRAVDVLLFDLSFLAGDRGLMKKQCIFFLEGPAIYSYDAYRSHPLFARLTEQVSQAMNEQVPALRSLGGQQKE